MEWKFVENDSQCLVLGWSQFTFAYLFANNSCYLDRARMYEICVYTKPNDSFVLH